MSDFEPTWASIRACEGEQFTTVRGLPFTYKISGDHLQPSRTKVELPKAHFRKVFEVMPIDGPGDVNQLVMGSRHSARGNPGARVSFVQLLSPHCVGSVPSVALEAQASWPSQSSGNGAGNWPSPIRVGSNWVGAARTPANETHPPLFRCSHTSLSNGGWLCS